MLLFTFLFWSRWLDEWMGGWMDTWRPCSFLSFVSINSQGLDDKMTKAFKACREKTKLQKQGNILHIKERICGDDISGTSCLASRLDHVWKGQKANDSILRYLPLFAVCVCVWVCVHFKDVYIYSELVNSQRACCEVNARWFCDMESQGLLGGAAVWRLSAAGISFMTFTSVLGVFFHIWVREGLMKD